MSTPNNATPSSLLLSPSNSIDPGLLQDRVRLYLKVLFLIDMGFYLFYWVLFFTGVDIPRPNANVEIQRGLRWSISALLGVGWYLAASKPRPRALMLGLETVGTLVLAWIYVYLTMMIPNGRGPAIALLMTNLALVLRAAIVPSPVTRTLVIGGLAIGITASSTFGCAQDLPTLAGIWLTALGTAFVIASGVISYVIYGLRRAVSHAKRLGQYELTRKLGEGGMGKVYEATHVLLSRRTALKLLPIERLGEETIKRFETEVRQTSRLEHPNSIYVYDFGRTPDGQFYYAMEYLDGLTLQELGARWGPLPPGRVVHLLKQAAAALAEAHSMNLVHRDIKPANIMITRRGLQPDSLKVLDFGLVKFVDSPDPGITQENSIIGTPKYLAPEAVQTPLDVGPEADIYALGAVGYFLLTGTEVFSAKSVVEICAKHLSEIPEAPSKRLQKPLPEDLEMLILRCLEKAPEDRYANGSELLLALEALEALSWDRQQANAWWDANQDDLADAPKNMETEQLTVDFGARRRQKRNLCSPR